MLFFFLGALFGHRPTAKTNKNRNKKKEIPFVWIINEFPYGFFPISFGPFRNFTSHSDLNVQSRVEVMAAAVVVVWGGRESCFRYENWAWLIYNLRETSLQLLPAAWIKSIFKREIHTVHVHVPQHLCLYACMRIENYAYAVENSYKLTNNNYGNCSFFPILSLSRSLERLECQDFVSER